MIFQRPQKKFNELLKEKDKDLWETLEEIKRRGLSEWIPLLHFDRGSHAGYPHLLNVEENVNRMVTDEIKETFSAGEIFLLLSSIFLHDIGRTVEKINEKNTKHHELSKDIINKCWAELGLPNEKIAEYCGIIVDSHRDSGKKNNEKIKELKKYGSVSLAKYGRLRIPLIAALLRIADETDDSWTRSLQNYLYNKLKSNGENLVKGYRKLIDDVEFCIEGECILLHLPNLEIDNKIEKKTDEEIKLQNKRDIERGVWRISVKEREQIYNDCRKIHNLLSEDRQWQIFLKEYGIIFNKALIDYRNRILGDVNKDYFQKFGKVFSKESDILKRPGVKELTDALMRLYLGSMDYNKFSWKALEAEVGQPLTDREKWLVYRINLVSELNVISYPADQIRIEFEIDAIKQIREDLGITDDNNNQRKKKKRISSLTKRRIRERSLKKGFSK
jgi:hypothetical protein